MLYTCIQHAIDMHNYDKSIYANMHVTCMNVMRMYHACTMHGKCPKSMRVT